MQPTLTVVGAAGRMGRRIIALALESQTFDIVGAVEAAGHPDIGKDAGVLAGVGQINVPITNQFPPETDVVIDFSLPEAAVETADICQAKKTALVMGTTGLDDQARQKLSETSEKIPVIYGTNMSVGMNVLFAVVGELAKMLGDEYDIEIVEHHHRFKKDSPSGSALTIAENICRATGLEFPTCIRNGREGKDALREKSEIGMHAIRAGDIVGYHSVMFATLGENLSISHTATNRDNFARGAVKAAQWLAGKEPGAYTMADVLGLK